MSDLAPLDAYCAGLISSLQPDERRKLARQIATGIRANQAKRIASQRNPDDSPFAARKPQTFRGKKGGIRRGMFAKLRTSRFLKMQTNSNEAVITFAGQVQRIAQVHQFGLRDKVNRRRNIEVDYTARELLGITSADVSLVEELVLNHLAR